MGGSLESRSAASISVDPDILYVEEGSVLTSAGSAAGLDLCLHIVRRDHGAAVANEVARRLVLAPHREGGQRQFGVAPMAAGAGGGRLAALMDWLPAHLDEPLTGADLAGRAGMSLRAFQRRFQEAFGTTPGRWLIRARVARARELAETTDLSVARIAEQAGFGSVETLRHHFRRLVGTTHARYRRRFARGADGVECAGRRASSVGRAADL